MGKGLANSKISEILEITGQLIDRVYEICEGKQDHAEYGIKLVLMEILSEFELKKLED